MTFRFEDYGKNFLLIGLFIVCMIAFAVNLSNEYGFDGSRVLDSSIPYDSLSNNITKSNERSNSWKDSFTEENPQQESGLLVFKAIWGVMGSIWRSFLIIPNLIFNMLQDVLGIPPLVTGTIVAIMIIYLIFAGWRVMKGAD